MKGEVYTPLFGRGDVAVKLDGKVYTLALTPRVCALIEDKAGVDAYLDALTGFANQDEDGNVRVKAKRALAIGEALFEGNGYDPRLCDKIGPVDLAIIITRMISGHMRPSSDADPQEAADTA